MEIQPRINHHILHQHVIVEKWFHTPIGYVDLPIEEAEKINDAILNWIDNNRSMVYPNSNENVKYTYDSLSNVVKEPRLSFINEIFVKYAKEFLTEINIKKNTEIEVKYSWLNIFPPNAVETAHVHHGNLFAGVYYVAGHDNTGNFVVDDPIDVRLLWYDNYRHYLIEDHNTLHYKPKTGRIIFFPSWLYHGVSKNNTNVDRISLAFNVNVSSRD